MESESENMSTRFDGIDAQRAKEIARIFLQQHQSVFDLESTFEDGIWLVKAKVSSFADGVRKIRIDPKNGRIIAVE